jgi:O-antigen biosynthesis protein
MPFKLRVPKFLRSKKRRREDRVEREKLEQGKRLNNLLSRLQFTIEAPFGIAASEIADINPMSINWVIPDIGIGSGGHINIFRTVGNLERLGYECRIIIFGRSEFTSSEMAKNFIDTHFSRIDAPVIMDVSKMPPAQYTFATNWETAYAVRDFRSTKHKCYFVQDFEPWFFAPGSEAAFAEQTYRFGFHGITAGGWLASKLHQEYGMQTTASGFSFDKDRYSHLPRTANINTKRILFYARPSTPRRGFELGILVLKELARRMPDIEIVLAGSNMSDYSIPFRHINMGIVALDDLPQLYSNCDACLVLSFTNLSLLPLELMACGCVVVSNSGPNVEWLLNKHVATLAVPTITDLSNALIEVLKNDDYRHSMAERGLALAHSTDWLDEARKIAATLQSLNNAV